MAFQEALQAEVEVASRDSARVLHEVVIVVVVLVVVLGLPSPVCCFFIIGVNACCGGLMWGPVWWQNGAGRVHDAYDHRGLGSSR